LRLVSAARAGSRAGPVAALDRAAGRLVAPGPLGLRFAGQAMR